MTQKQPVKRLLPDGAYSTPYRTDGDPGPRSIHAYSAQAEERKKRFLKDARAFLKSVAAELAAHGFSQSDVRVNEAGIAVSGDAYADFKNPELDRWLHVQISETCVRFPLAHQPEIGQPINTLAAMTTRADGVYILARWHTPDTTPDRNATMGPNTYLDANLSSRELTPSLLTIAGIKPATLPEREPLQASLFDAAAA